MSCYLLSEEAQEDLREIKLYIAKDGTDARRILAEFRQAFRSVAKMPRMGHTREDLTSRPLLRPGTHPLEIVAVLHGRRNIQRLLRERL